MTFCFLCYRIYQKRNHAEEHKKTMYKKPRQKKTCNSSQENKSWSTSETKKQRNNKEGVARGRRREPRDIKVF